MKKKSLFKSIIQLIKDWNDSVMEVQHDRQRVLADQNRAALQVKAINSMCTEVSKGLAILRSSDLKAFQYELLKECRIHIPTVESQLSCSFSLLTSTEETAIYLITDTEEVI